MRLPSFAAWLAAGLCAFPPAASAAALDDNANMRILAARSRIMRLNNDYFMEQLKQKGAPTNEEEALEMYRGRVGCGSVDIGNQVVSSGIGNEISVIILGDVINVGNRCTR
ncbi:MAG: hypothetical protein H6R10_1929 [Rhodocyclaceae bacterium]|nr:hypothetical protein [Rhodocyclaceae bacterium]